MSTTLHFISHSHWDREWYMSFERHRIRLVEFMDGVLETLDNNPDFESFHLDGQVIVLEDYLEIKPQMLEKIQHYVAEGRLILGPWYVLQDEYLISAEANVRNMLYGIRKGRQFGQISLLGYLPDAFDNISQMPQILRGFGIDNAVFGRTRYAAIDWSQTDRENVQKQGRSSEVRWASPDGSEVLGIIFANWYDNANEVPAKKAEAVQFIQQAKDRAEAVAATPQLLLMNGCDHQPVQSNLPQILKSVAGDFPDAKLLHSNFPDYIDAIKPYTEQLPVLRGELAAQDSNGHHLVNTASSRIYLKQMNHQAQNLLEKWAEPFGVFAWNLGDEYRKELLAKSWEYLLQNHPHDSICGCSVDDVHEEMVVRFKKSIALSEEVLNRELAYIESKIDTSSLTDDEVPLVVFNPFPWEVSEVVKTHVDLPEQDSASVFSMQDGAGEAIAVEAVALGRTFTYTLPDDAFRKVNYVNRFEIEFQAEAVPALGYKTFILKKQAEELPYQYSYGERYAENEYLRLDILENGSLTIANKVNRRVFEGLNVFEDSGDVGNEYNFVAPPGNSIVTSERSSANVKIVTQGKSFITFLITHSLTLPKSADKKKQKRLKSTRDLLVRSYVTLRAGNRRIDVRTEFDNSVKDHRFRALFPSHIDTELCYADGHFDLVKRRITPGPNWENPSNCERQQAFVEVHDEQSGLMIANRGLPEYEILRDGRNTIALTLVRSVAEMGDWGYFPTPEAQCQGKQVVEYSVIPYGGDFQQREAIEQAYQFSGSPLKTRQASIHSGELELQQSFLKLEGEDIVLSCLKKHKELESVILRAYNLSQEERALSIAVGEFFDRAYQTNLDEERESSLSVKKGNVSIQVSPRKIITIELER